jgi:hypothetical protein
LKVVFWEFFGNQKIFAFFWLLARLIVYNQPSPLPAAENSWRGEPLLPSESRHFIDLAFTERRSIYLALRLRLEFRHRVPASLMRYAPSHGRIFGHVQP